MAHNKWWNKEETTARLKIISDFMVFSLVWLTKGNFEASQRAAICHEQRTSWQQCSSSRNVTPSACLCANMSAVRPSKYSCRTDTKSRRKYGVKGLLSTVWDVQRVCCLGGRDTSEPSLPIPIRINNASIHKSQNTPAPVPDHQQSTAERQTERWVNFTETQD